MRIIAVRTLREYWQLHPEVEGPLQTWIYEVEHAAWQTSNDVLNHFPYVDIIPGNRAVFNIKGKKFRLVVKIHYNTGIVYIRFIGTHKEYDRIDVEKI